MAARIVPTRAKRVNTGEVRREGFFKIPITEAKVSEVMWDAVPGCFHAHSVSCDDPTPEAGALDDRRIWRRVRPGRVRDDPTPEATPQGGE